MKTIRSNNSENNECVILLHGLARTDKSMKKLTNTLDKAGYQTINIKYPSTKKNIEQLANIAISKALSQCPEDAIINFVTHSFRWNSNTTVFE